MLFEISPPPPHPPPALLGPEIKAPGYFLRYVLRYVCLGFILKCNLGNVIFFDSFEALVANAIVTSSPKADSNSKCNPKCSGMHNSCKKLDDGYFCVCDEGYEHKSDIQACAGNTVKLQLFTCYQQHINNSLIYDDST